MSKPLLIDKYGRQLTYLRLSVTDRCNFRCYYCMPEEGMDFAARQELLSFEELYQLSALFCSLGVNKIRITGGEPFVRAGIIPFLRKLSQIPGLEEITITTNGTLSKKHIQALKEIGIRKINISLDSLDRERFHQITRRDSFEAVYACIFQLLESGFEVKLNCVVAEGKNIQDLVPFVELTKDYPLAVRFLEEMPFNGTETFQTPQWSYRKIYAHLNAHYPVLEQLPNAPSSTSVNYRVPGYEGTFGIIPSFSRTFCGTCNRIRLGATGELRTCLYGPPATNLRDLLRLGFSQEQIEQEILDAVSQREKDGFAAEASHAWHASMSLLGG
ncbi:GTP 3',8-cyclase MoaA [Rufibacter psychrotolerans]|uniref:GTP 3',8-cyclase MoaA n=1 Tax=Rufibacter psychrotolerans TaxID=2812556 RepID=UPI0019679F95|nr:GTP 3',8-cyclase MoaA [Rufibacter sp. SYSU D00308]